jgi:folate-dependent phosphoribosylglycinamide formyltransferase PurN
MVESADENERNLQRYKKNKKVRSEQIVIWCGAAPNQKALANKAAARYKVAGIVVDKHTASVKKKQWTKLPGVIRDRIRFKKIYDAWSELMNYYDTQFPQWPAGVPVVEVDSINDNRTEKFTSEKNPGLIAVSGTALIKEPLISVPAAIGIINLHTGLSPYVKGGPNCTNWCIANNNFHLAGNTIMWLNAGIDTGNIITTETVDIINANTLVEAHRKVMDHAHDLYLRAIGYLMKTETSYNSVPQSSISKGSLYLTKMWTSEKKKQLLRNWRKRKLFTAPETPVIVPLPVHE